LAGGKGGLRLILDPYNEPSATGMSGFRRRGTNLSATRVDGCRIDRVVLDSNWKVAWAQTLEEIQEVSCYAFGRNTQLRMPSFSGTCGERLTPAS
jgi:hypothetical protein